MLISLLKMLIAHLIGDFILQPASWVEKRKTKIQYLFYHVTVHMILLVLFFINDLVNNWQNILFIIAAHLAIDSIKVGFEGNWKGNPVIIFLADQFLHVLSIFAVFFFRSPASLVRFSAEVAPEKLLLLVLVVIVNVSLIPVIIRIFFSKWQKETDFNSKRRDTLFDAGTIIGVMERLLILGFVYLELYEGVGFLLAAKSIFRFGDLSNAKDTKFTEYVMIGTLLSFGLGMLVAFGFKYFLKMI